MNEKIAKKVIIFKYEESFQLENELVKILEKSNRTILDEQKIEFFNDAINSLLISIDAIANKANISKNELDKIFSEIYINS